MEYTYKLVNGHIIVECGRANYLIDTGAPASVNGNGEIDFAGVSYSAQSYYLGVTPESLSQHIGTHIDGLIDADILNEYDTLIDPGKLTLLLTKEDLDLSGISAPLELFMGIPIVEVIVDKSPLRVFFDTGAQLSYLNSDIASLYPRLGDAKDFYPGVGEFTTPTYEVSCMLSTEQFTLRVGILPPLLQATLMMANTSGILGTMILEKYRVLYSPQRKLIALESIENKNV